MTKKATESRLNVEQAKKAVKALAAYLKRQADIKSDGKSQLFEDESDIQLIISLKRIADKAKNKPVLVKIPHTIYGRDGQEICLITKDPQQDFREKLDRSPVDGVTKVLGISKLRANYKQYKDRRVLRDSYDLFLADDRVLPLLQPLLGKIFFSKKKQPMPVNIKGSDAGFGAALAEARDATFFHLSAGPCCNVKVAKSSFSVDEIHANIVAVLNTIVKHIPQGWDNIQSLCIKSHDSVSLPIYNSIDTLDAPAEEPTQDQKALSKTSKKTAATKSKATPKDDKTSEAKATTQKKSKGKKRKAQSAAQ